ncbi:ATP-dependent endonuclease [Flavobacterium sp.]|uniref:ATP-dependent nuclease n=1 Tax=Flavobacterium sp. TaxID=239 RepID=UPI003751DB19
MKKIKHIEITNFKSIKHLEINDCNKINVFIGQPNAGKSNILEALGFFGMIIDNNNNSLEKFIRFKINSELFFEENTTKNINIKINSKQLDILSTESLGQPKKNYTNISNSLKYDNSILSSPWEETEEISTIKKYLFTEPFFRQSDNRITLDYPSGNNLVQVIVSNPELRKVVNKLFKDNSLKLLIEKTTNELKIFKEYQDGTVFTLSYNLIADTLQRLIFYKAAIMSNENSVLLFEEPEAHCFEPYILEFTNAVKYDENDNQFFIVTHSDYIVKEFLRDDESKENTNIYLVNNVDGETKVKLLDKKNNEDVFEFGMNIFFNFESLWETN